MNKAIIIGRVTKDIDVRITTTGKSVCNFTLAVNREFKNDKGEREADFISCVSYGSQADIISKYVHKGDRFGVTGRIQTRNYEKNGQKVYVTEVIVESFEFLESKKSENNTEPEVFTDVTPEDVLPF